jgi:ferredoxin-NADP reductase
MMELKKTLMITGVRDQARLIRSFDLRADTEVEFTPGQVAVLRVEGEQPAYFAFAGAPEDRDLEVLVKQKIGASAVIYNMCVGDQIELLSIAGHGFNLDAMKGRDLIFVAMGTGVAPLRSALRHALKRKDEIGR